MEWFGYKTIKIYWSTTKQLEEEMNRVANDPMFGGIASIIQGIPDRTTTAFCQDVTYWHYLWKIT